MKLNLILFLCGSITLAGCLGQQTLSNRPFAEQLGGALREPPSAYKTNEGRLFSNVGLGIIDENISGPVFRAYRDSVFHPEALDNMGFEVKPLNHGFEITHLASSFRMIATRGYYVSLPPDYNEAVLEALRVLSPRGGTRMPLIIVP